MNYIKGTIQIKYEDNNDYKIEKNEKDITELKSYKQYLKNVYNILFYNEKTQIDFRVIINIFMKKYFKIII